MGKKAQLPTTGHTQLPGGGVANIGSIDYFVGNPPLRKHATLCTIGVVLIITR